MNAVWIVVFSTIAAIGNALFALAQKQSSGTDNSLLFIAASALIACLLCLISSPFVGPADPVILLKTSWKPLLLSGIGLFVTYIGFNLLYTRFGTSPYAVYACMSILTTTVGIGFWYLKETINTYHIAAIILAVVAIVLFSVGQSRA